MVYALNTLIVFQSQMLHAFSEVHLDSDCQKILMNQLLWLVLAVELLRSEVFGKKEIIECKKEKNLERCFCSSDADKRVIIFMLMNWLRCLIKEFFMKYSLHYHVNLARKRFVFLNDYFYVALQFEKSLKFCSEKLCCL